MHPTPYPQLNSVLQELVESVEKVLDRDLIGAYLQGSFAVGDFDANSDCDFIMVTQQELSEQEVQRLQAVHERIYALDIPWAQHLEGSYFPREVLRSYAYRGEELWYLNHGSRSLIRHSHCNMVVVRWVVRANGVTLQGPPAGTLVDPIPVEVLREEILAVIRDWGGDIPANPDRYSEVPHD